MLDSITNNVKVTTVTETNNNMAMADNKAKIHLIKEELQTTQE
jgi:hypothetical protein